MAAAEGTVIACHTNDEFDAQMDEAYEAGKLVRRTRALRPDRSITILCSSCEDCDAWHN
jgi:hypothetical protein